MTFAAGMRRLKSRALKEGSGETSPAFFCRRSPAREPRAAAEATSPAPRGPKAPGGQCGGMAAAANGTAGAWKGDRATIPAARLTQTTCGRFTEASSGNPDAPGVYEDSVRISTAGFPFGGRQAGVSLGAICAALGFPDRPVVTSRMCRGIRFVWFTVMLVFEYVRNALRRAAAGDPAVLSAQRLRQILLQRVVIKLRVVRLARLLDLDPSLFHQVDKEGDAFVVLLGIDLTATYHRPQACQESRPPLLVGGLRRLLAGELDNLAGVLLRLQPDQDLQFEILVLAQPPCRAPMPQK